MARGFNIRAWLGLETKSFSKGLTQARGKLTGFQRMLKGTNDVLRGLKFTAIGVTGVGAITRAITVLKEFQTSMARVKVISRATPEEFKKMTEVAREMGATTRFSATEAASSLQYLSMAGLSASQSITALPATMNLAGASMVDMGTSADMVTNILGGFNLKVEDLEDIVDLMAHTTRISNTNLIELYEAMNKAAPLATQLGISAQEVAQAMALFANKGVKAAEAGVAYAGVLTRLLKEPKMVAKSLQELGIDISETSIREEGFIGTMKRLKEAGINATQMAKIFGLHVKTAGVFANMSAEEIDLMAEKLKDYNGAAKEMSEEGIGGIDKAIKIFISKLDEFFIKLGYEEGLAGWIETIIKGAARLIEWFTKLSGSMKLLTVALVALTFKLKTVAAAFNAVSLSILGKSGVSFSFAAATKSATHFFKLMSASYGPLMLIIGSLALMVNNLNLADEAMKKISRGSDESLDNLDKLLKVNKNIGGSSVKELQEASTLAEIEIEKQKKIVEGFGDSKSDRAKRAASGLQNLYGLLGRINKELNLKVKSESESEALAQISLKEMDEEANLLKQEQEAIGKQISQITELIKDSEFWLKYNKDSAEFLKKEVDYIKEISKYFPTYEEGNGFYKILFDSRVEANKLAKTIKELKLPEISFIPHEELDRLAQLNAELLKMNDRSQLTRNAIASFGEELMSMTVDSAESFEEFAQNIGNSLRRVIGGLIAQGVAGAVSHALAEAPWPIGLIAAPLAGATAQALFSQMIPKFATGGIIGGTSFTGDKILAGLNSGEMILSKSQQTNLFKLIDQGGVGGNSVNFEIRGDKLVGVLENYSKKNKRIK